MYSFVPEGFVLAKHLALRLGLPQNYFKRALKENISINAEFLELDNKFLYIKLPRELEGRIDSCVFSKISKKQIEDYNFIFRLSKKTLLGGY